MTFNPLSKLTAASLVAAAALGFTAMPADAQTFPSRSAAVVDIQSNVVQAQYYGSSRYRSGRHYRGGYRYGGRRGYRHRNRFGSGIGFGLGFGLGLAVPHLTTPYSTPYAYSAPGGYASGGHMVPGSPQWIQYCSQKYNSFDPSSGTYLAYSGVRRPCQVP